MIYFRLKDGPAKNKKFKILDKNNKIVTDKNVIEYIKKLVIPPAYNDVKIFYEKNPKILFQGYDDKMRLQQIYSQSHKKKAAKKKFCHLLNFGKILPKIESDISKYMKTDRFTKNKIISIIIKIIMKCGFRMGNLKYQKLYGSFGISNIFKEHVKMSGKSMIIKFIGKKGVLNECEINDNQIILEMNKLLSNKKPKAYVFTYTQNNEEKVITALEINKWLKEYHINTTSKHFRTWDVNILFIEYMRSHSNEFGDPTKLTNAKRKKAVVVAMKVISCQVNNTPGICRREYLHIDLLTLYLEQPKKFKKWFFGCKSARVCFINYLEDFCK